VGSVPSLPVAVNSSAVVVPVAVGCANVSFHNDPQAWMYQRYSSGRGCIWRRPLVAVVGVLPSLQVAVSGRSVLLPRDSAAIRMCACAFNGLYGPGPLHLTPCEEKRRQALVFRLGELDLSSLIS